MNEYWDLYDRNREKLGRLHRRGDPTEAGTYHVVVNAWVMNSKGQVLLTKRHPDKVYGNLWECSGGAVLAGESSLEGVLRELREEVGLCFAKEDGVLLHALIREEHHDMLDIYLFRKDVEIDTLRLQPEEVIDARWATRDEYYALFEAGEVVPIINHLWRFI